jgi:hypothetical protein
MQSSHADSKRGGSNGLDFATSARSRRTTKLLPSSLPPIFLTRLSGRLLLDQLTAFTHRKMRHVPQRNIQFVARMPALAFPDECAFLRQVRKVTCRCRRRCARDGAVLAAAHVALESFRPFPEHPQERLLLPVVDLSADAVE